MCVFLGLTSEGIYRKSGVNSRVAALCDRFRQDARSLRLKEGEHQVDDVSNTLKRFFRDLEEGLFTSEDSRSWLSNAGKISHYSVSDPGLFIQVRLFKKQGLFSADEVDADCVLVWQ